MMKKDEATKKFQEAADIWKRFPAHKHANFHEVKWDDLMEVGGMFAKSMRLPPLFFDD
jgi:hypothetical protein